MSPLLCGCTESTFAIQQHIKTKYVSQIWKLYFLSSLRDLFKVTVGRLLSLIRVCDKLKGTASEVAGWILFTSQPLWLVSSMGLEVIFNPKGQTLLLNLWFWKLFRPVSKKNKQGNSFFLPGVNVHVRFKFSYSEKTTPGKRLRSKESCLSDARKPQRDLNFTPQLPFTFPT